MSTDCPSCEAGKAYMTPDEIQASVAAQLELEPFNRVSEAVQKQRQAICSTCPLAKAGTCTACGCFIDFRTALANKACPEHKWDTGIAVPLTQAN